MQYVWLWWSVWLLVAWAAVYIALGDRARRREMLWVSALTALLGLTEPFFVPEYWMPPSLFDLAARTGFDIESILFAFGIGGLASAAYGWIFRSARARMGERERHSKRHRFHTLALISAPAVFLVLLSFSALNPIYAAIIALFAGGVFTVYCRPDLKVKMLVSAAIFTLLYAVYFGALELTHPGYVEAVWNLAAVSGVLLLGIPIEELLFAASFGFLWSGVYEHFTWKKVIPLRRKEVRS